MKGRQGTIGCKGSFSCRTFTEPGEILKNEDAVFTDSYLLLSVSVLWGSTGLWVQGFHLESKMTVQQHCPCVVSPDRTRGKVPGQFGSELFPTHFLC